MILQKLGYPIIKTQIKFEPDIVTARQRTRRLAELVGFDNQDQARLGTAVSELARNVFQYAGGGSVEFFFNEHVPQTLFIRVSDNGPGISQIDDILNGVYVSKSGMGVGLIGSKKLMDFFEIETAPASGTKIIVGKLLEKRSRKLTKEDIIAIVDKLATKQTDSPFEEIQNQNRELLNVLAELRTSKDALSELNRELNETNRGVVALYAELDEKALSLQKANEIKTSFLSNMTHEFRTPLSSVISLTRLLLERVDGELSVEQEKQVNYIRQSSESLLELVNDLLDLAKVEAGKVSINPTKFSIDELLSGLRGMFRPILGSNSAVDIHVEAESGAYELETDQAKLSQILRNLVSNAVKFTESGHITIAASLCEDSGVEFRVTDSGIGIAPEFLNVIFEDFGQIESKLQRKHKGSGLGLPLSRKLARLLGGNLSVESTIGKGSVFRVVIPRVYSGLSEGILISGEKNQDHDDHINPNATSRFKIVLIDDDEASRYILRGLVSEQVDAEFIEFSQAKDGITYIENHIPDLVFLDLTMPELDGFEALRILRYEKNLKDLPIIVNTAKKLTDDEKNFLTTEATAHLTKERTDQQVAVRDLRRALVKAGFDYKSM